MKSGAILGLALFLAQGQGAWAGPDALVTWPEAKALMHDHGLTMADAQPNTALEPAPEPSPVTGTGRYEMAELQAALTQVAILAGANDQLAIVQAQQGPAIYLRQGNLTLAELAAQMQAAGQAGLERQADGTGYRLGRPLIIWSDAALRLEPGDRLVMDRAAGAFILGFGDLQLQGAIVMGEGPAHPQSPLFAPFVLLAGQGQLWAENSDFRDLGMPGTKLYGGLTVLTNGWTTATPQPIVLRQNRLETVAKLALIGAQGARIEGNAIAGGLVLDGGRDLAVLGNDIHPFQGTGLRLSGAATGVLIQGNLVQGGPSTGIAVADGVNGLRLESNLVLRNGGDGISLSASRCARVLGNLVMANAAVGLRLEDQTALRAENNAFVQNGTAAIDLRGQGEAAGTTLLARNTFDANREGLRGAGIGAVMLAANRTEHQLPRLFGGEFAAYLPAYLAETQQGGGDSFLIVHAGKAAAPAAPDCQGGM